jgi:hypothetical protein
MAQTVGRRGFTFRDPGTVPERSLWKLWPKKWHRDRVLSKFASLTLSVLFANNPYTLFMCVLSMLYNVTRNDFNRITHTLSSCAFYRCCIMLLGMISTAFVKKDTSVSHDATCYLQGHFLRHVRLIAKSAYTSLSHLSVSLSVRPSVRHVSSLFSLNGFP